MCPFEFKDKWTPSFGIASDFYDYMEEQIEIKKDRYYKKYPTCWKRFLHWLGLI